MDVKEKIEAFRVLRTVAVSAAAVGSKDALLDVMECLRTLIDRPRLYNVLFNELPTRYNEYDGCYAPYHKIQAIKALRELTSTHHQSMGLKDAKEAVERHGSVLLSGLTFNQAHEATKRFDDLDVKVNVVEA